jgi:coproporphyrinogen III oxidase-like Fe-S oxidoreductase
VETPGSLYLHVPFCPQVCPYCDFHKMRRHEGLVAAYLTRIEAEAAALAARWPGPLRTLYLGGGTPSHLDDAELARVLGAVRRGLGRPGRARDDAGGRPGHVRRGARGALARRGRHAGVDRHAVDAGRRAALPGRSHTGAEALRAADDALAAGLAVSLDVITAVPGQDARADLEAPPRAARST